MKCNPDEFRHLVEGFNLSKPKQDELIHMVWRIMENVVDRAWNADPVQVALEGRDNISQNDAIDSSPVIELESHEYRDFSSAFNKKKGDERR